MSQLVRGPVVAVARLAPTLRTSPKTDTHGIAMMCQLGVTAKSARTNNG